MNENIFTPLEEVSFSAYDLTYTTDEFGIRSYTSTSDYEHITITYKYNGVIDDMHNFYYAEKSGINATTYFDFKTLDVNNYWHKGIRSLDIKDNNTHKITIYLDNRVTNRQIRPGVYVEDLNVLQKHLEIIKDKYLNLTVSKNIFSTTYKGTITTDGSMDDLIFTLPFEKQFKVKIDGKEVETYKKLNIFTAVDIKGLTNGEHTVEIIYLDSGYIAGFTLTLVGILVTSTICLYYLLDEKKLILIKEKLKFFNKKK